MLDEKLEKMVLATMMQNDVNAIESGLMHLDEFCFTLDWHRKVFKTICHLSNTNQSCDSIMVAEYSKVAFEDIALINEYATFASIESQCLRLRELSNIRGAFNMSSTVQGMAHNGLPFSEIAETIEKTLMGFSGGNKEHVVTHIKEGLQETFESIEGKNNSNDPVHTGFPALDGILGGMFPGEFVIVGARPGMGKTAFALNIMMNVSKSGGDVLMFSAEMTTTQIITRYLSSESEVDSTKIRSKKIYGDDFAKITMAASVVNDSNIYINTSKRNNIHDLRSIARRHIRKHPNTKVIVVDYLQLIRDTKEHKNDKRLANEEKSLVLCELASDLKIPVVALAQLSRGCESRTNKRPMPSDLKEAGQLEQDAHQIMFLYRGFKYGDTYKDKDGNSVDYKENDIDVIVSKNREGTTGTVEMVFRGEYSKFYNIDVVHEEPEQAQVEDHGW